jgi:helix-turn-helix protein
VTLTKPTQSERVLEYLRQHPLATAMDISMGVRPWCSNPRARISDLRAAGYTIKPVKRSDGRTGFVVLEPEPVQTALFFSGPA